MASESAICIEKAIDLLQNYIYTNTEKDNKVGEIWAKEKHGNVANLLEIRL